MIKIQEEKINFNVEPIIENEYFNCYINSKSKYIICKPTKSYIPIELFIETFESMFEIIKEQSIEKFIFDKRALRAFHQPTMEWYFVEWKQKAANYGLTKHRKILPADDWFRKCVEAGKSAILKENPELKLEQLDIKYRESIEECIAC